MGYIFTQQFQNMESKFPSNQENVLDPDNVPKQTKPTCEFSPEELEASNKQQPTPKKKTCVLSKDWKNQENIISHLAFYLNEFLKNPLHSYGWREERPFQTYRRMQKYMNKKKIQCKAYDNFLRMKHQEDFDNFFQYVCSQAQKYRGQDQRVQRLLSEVQRRVKSIQNYMNFVQENIRRNQRINQLLTNILCQDQVENLVSKQNL